MRLAERLSSASLGGKVFFCNSGTEADEAAIKLARKARQGGDIVVVHGAFHGRTYGALSATPQESKQAPFAPLVPGLPRLRPRSRGARGGRRRAHRGGAARADPGRDAACTCSREELLQAARAACDEHGAALIFDEIQIGMGRTGSLWAYEQTGVRPDAITLAKALAGGLPMGALVTGERLADVLEPGDHGSTFAGGPLIARAALAALEATDDERCWRTSASTGRGSPAGLARAAARHAGARPRADAGLRARRRRARGRAPGAAAAAARAERDRSDHAAAAAAADDRRAGATGPSRASRGRWRAEAMRRELRGRLRARRRPRADRRRGRLRLHQRRVLLGPRALARARARPRSTGSQRVVGLYAADGSQVGFARAVTDGATVGYLADVYVLEAHRGRGLGLELVREALDGGDGRPANANVRWLLHTADAQGLYEKLGFSTDAPSYPLMERSPRAARRGSRATGSLRRREQRATGSRADGLLRGPARGRPPRPAALLGRPGHERDAQVDPGRVRGRGRVPDGQPRPARRGLRA